MPVIIASLVFAVSLSLLPYTKNDEDCRPAEVEDKRANPVKTECAVSGQSSWTCLCPSSLCTADVE